MQAHKCRQSGMSADPLPSCCARRRRGFPTMAACAGAPANWQLDSAARACACVGLAWPVAAHGGRGNLHSRRPRTGPGCWVSVTDPGSSPACCRDSSNSKQHAAFALLLCRTKGKKASAPVLPPKIKARGCWLGRDAPALLWLVRAGVYQPGATFTPVLLRPCRSASPTRVFRTTRQQQRRTSTLWCVANQSHSALIKQCINGRSPQGAWPLQTSCARLARCKQ